MVAPNLILPHQKPGQQIMKQRVNQGFLVQALRIQHNPKTSHKEVWIRNKHKNGRKEKADRAAGREHRERLRM